MIVFFRFPQRYWKHLRRSNPVEFPFAALSMRSKAAKRFRKVENAAAGIGKFLLTAEKKFRGLDSPDGVQVVSEGERFVAGNQVKQADREAAA